MISKEAIIELVKGKRELSERCERLLTELDNVKKTNKQLTYKVEGLERELKSKNNTTQENNLILSLKAEIESLKSEIQTLKSKKEETSKKKPTPKPKKVEEEAIENIKID